MVAASFHPVEISKPIFSIADSSLNPDNDPAIDRRLKEGLYVPEKIKEISKRGYEAEREHEVKSRDEIQGTLVGERYNGLIADGSFYQSIKLYYIGDSIGAMAEGGAGKTVSYGRALTGLKAFPKGTDESDTARLFIRYCEEVGADNFSITGWYAYHAQNRMFTTYGKTWRDHFRTVEYILKKNGRLDYERLVSLSKDRGSNGNGCLALAYPIAKIFGDNALEVAGMTTAGTHYLARPSVLLAVEFFQSKKTLDQVIKEAFPAKMDNGLQLTPLSHGCLWAAAVIAKERTLKKVIQKALDMGGDVDSYLSLGLLMWAADRHWEGNFKEDN